MSNSEKSVRIQTSILNPYEKVVLQAIGKRIPACITADHLTLLGLLGSCTIALGYILTMYGPQWLWLASFGFFLNWLGDSLDGTIARLRNQQRPLYGFYIDHNVDCICQFLMVIGVGMSAYMSMWVALLLIIPYYMLEVYVMINAHLKNEFKLTYGKLGPTELRLIIVMINMCLLFIEPLRTWTLQLEILNRNIALTAMDLAGLFIFSSLMFFYITSLIKDTKYYSKIDPLKK